MYLRFSLLFLTTLLAITSVAKNKQHFEYDSLLNEYSCEGNSCKNIQYLINQIKIGTNDSILLASYYHYAGVYYYKDSNYKLSIKYNKKAAELRLKFNGGLYWKSLRNIGASNYKLDNYVISFKYFNKAYHIYDKKDDHYTIVLLRSMAKSLRELGEYEYAEQLMRKAIKLKASKKELVRALNTLGYILYESKKINDAIPLLERALEINEQIKNISNNKHYDDNRIEAINPYGACLDKKGKSEEAINLYIREIDRIFETDNLEYLTTLYNNLATSLNSIKKYDEAIAKLKFSIEILKERIRELYNYDYSASYENLADNYTDLRQFEKALMYYQKALINVTNNFRYEDLFHNPNPNDTTLFIYSSLDMIRILHLKASVAVQYYQQNNNIKYLNLAYQTYQTVFNFHNQLQKDISTENSRLFQAKNIVPYIENALKTAYKLQNNNIDIGQTAFRFMEKNKATVLLQSMNEADALQFANLPDSLIEREKELKLYITEYKRQRNNAIGEKDSNKVERLNTLLFKEEQQHRQLITNLENNYPKYYQLKYQQNQTQLADIQTQLDNKTALLEYFVGDSAIYILSIQHNKSKLYQIPKPANWNQAIDKFRLALTNTETILAGVDKHHKDFAQYGNLLYKWLLQKPFKDMGHQIERLQIIPDAELNYIPFELLLTDTINKINYKKLPYLLRKQSIGYVYSAAFLFNKKTEINEALLPLAGFAADYSNTDIAQLSHAEESVENIANKVEGEPFLKATKEIFIKEAQKHKILFFATHAELDDNNPMNSSLIFTPTKDSTDYKLRAADLYNTALNVDMALLSACETGVGKIHKGEGVMSLARAFTYAGCPSLVMSLWRISDSSTPKITNAFFDYLQKGLTKDKALQKAKLTYLENSPERLSHPAYWAGLVATGDLSPIAINKKFNYWWTLPVLVLLAIGLFLLRYYKNKVI